MRWGCVTVLAWVVSGCVTPGFIADNMAGTMQDVADSFFSEESPDHAFAAGPGLLKQLDGFLRSSPENRDLLKFGAEMNCAFALTFLDEKDPEWAGHLYSKGREYALRGLSLSHEQIRDVLVKGDEASVKRALAEVEEEDLPFLFWTGLCWAGVVNAVKDVERVAELPVVEALIARSVEIDEDYYFAGGYLFFGMLYAGRTEMLGGDLSKGRQAFEKALELSRGAFLLTRVLYAKTYAVNAQDRKLFVELLTSVAENDSESPEQMRLPNNVARREAARLLSKIGDFFPGSAEPEENVEPLQEEDVDLDLD